MARILFYGKAGCISNRRQRRLLAASGHEVVQRDLLSEPWTAERLKRFFGGRPVNQWFNPSSPRLKSGEVKPAYLSEQDALALMLDDPLLIRRPLMACGERHWLGFDALQLDREIGLAALPDTDPERCSHPVKGACSTAEGG